jgi:hypothetical protein
MTRGRYVRKAERLELARRDRAKLERTGHVRVKNAHRLRAAFRELGLPLVEAETGLSAGKDGVYLYSEEWAMPKDLAAAETLTRIIEETEKR